MTGVAAASFWAGVLSGVLITVIGGVVLAVLVGAPKWWLDRRREQRRQAAAERQDRAPLGMGALAVAAELRQSAELSERCQTGHAVPETARMLPTHEWAARRNEMGRLRAEDRALWDEIEDTYAALQRSKRHGGYPPAADDLRGLADRLARQAD